MTLYCCKYTNENRDLILNYVRTKDELSQACRDVRRQGFIPVKSVITYSEETGRTETPIN